MRRRRLWIRTIGRIAAVLNAVVWFGAFLVIFLFWQDPLIVTLATVVIVAAVMSDIYITWRK